MDNNMTNTEGCAAEKQPIIRVEMDNVSDVIARLSEKVELLETKLIGVLRVEDVLPGGGEAKSDKPPSSVPIAASLETYKARLKGIERILTRLINNLEI